MRVVQARPRNCNCAPITLQSLWQGGWWTLCFPADAYAQHPRQYCCVRRQPFKSSWLHPSPLGRLCPSLQDSGCPCGTVLLGAIRELLESGRDILTMISISSLLRSGRAKKILLQVAQILWILEVSQVVKVSYKLFILQQLLVCKMLEILRVGKHLHELLIAISNTA